MRPSPEFSLAQLNALLAERVAEDIARLAMADRRELESALSCGGPRWSEITSGLLRDVPGCARGPVPRPAPVQQVTRAGTWTADICARLHRLVTDELAPGDALPSLAELAAMFHVGRGTIKKATAMLRAEGLIAVQPVPQGGSRLVVLAQAAEEPQAV